MRRVSIILFALFAGIVSASMFSPKAQAQSIAPTTEDLVRSADIVVVGKVSELKSEWNSDRSRIYSRVTVAVDQHIKGDEGQSSVTISTPGGEVDGVGEMYSHTARFKADEQVIVFAAADRQGQLKVVGGDEGKLTVTKNATTGMQMVSDHEPLTVFTNRLKAIVQAQSH
jgi:ATP-dependent protease ClpP protease subunit